MKITYKTTLRCLEREAWHLKDRKHASIKTWEAYNSFREGIVKQILDEVEVPLNEDLKKFIHSVVFYGVDSSMDNWTLADYFNNQE